MKTCFTFQILLCGLFMFMSSTRAFLCPEPAHVCICTEKVVHCVCNNRENVTLVLLLFFDIQKVLVQGCGTVVIPAGTLLHMDLESVQFLDIQRLQANSFSLAAAESIKNLHFEDIADLEIKDWGFSALNNMSSISMRNVTARNLKRGSFGLSHVEKFIIEDSYFESVEHFAFIVSNSSLFKITNTKFKTLNKVAIMMHNIEQVIFRGSEFQETNNGSFLASYVGHLNFENCTFRNLSTGSVFGLQLQTFSFQNSRVMESGRDAFKHVDVLKRAKFTDNTFIIAKPNSLFPSSESNGPLLETENFEVHGNRFSCNCRISWLWYMNNKGIFDRIIDTSACINFQNLQMSTFQPKFDGEGNCVNFGYVVAETYAHRKSKLRPYMTMTAGQTGLNSFAKKYICLLSLISHILILLMFQRQ